MHDHDRDQGKETCGENEAVPTLCLKFRFAPEVDALLDPCGEMVREALARAIDHHQRATHPIVRELYPTFLV